MNTKELLTKCVQDIDMALKMFGEYTFHDKGPYEVMDVRELVKEFENSGPDVAEAVLVALNSGTEEQAMVANCIFEDIAGTWDENWDERLSEVLN